MNVSPNKTKRRQVPVAGGWTTVINESSAIVLNFGASVLTLKWHLKDILYHQGHGHHDDHDAHLDSHIDGQNHLTMIEASNKQADILYHQDHAYHVDHEHDHHHDRHGDHLTLIEAGTKQADVGQMDWAGVGSGRRRTYFQQIFLWGQFCQFCQSWKKKDSFSAAVCIRQACSSHCNFENRETAIMSSLYI